MSILSLPDYVVSSETENNSRVSYFQRQTRQFNDSDKLKFKCKLTAKIDAFKNSFFLRAVRLWNSIPFDIRNIGTFDCFKVNLKEHLWIMAENELG